MAIGRIQSIGLPSHAGSAAARSSAGFADLLGQALSSLQGISDNANEKVNAMATGEDVEIHDVMMALEAESLAMNLATTVRNKAVEAYQEVFRMQM